MKIEISRTRLKKVGSRERKFLAGIEEVSFRNGDLLALLYALGVAAATLGLASWSAAATGGGAFIEQIPRAAAAVSLALLCSRILMGIDARDLLKRNSRILMLCVVGAVGAALSAAGVVFAASPALAGRFGFDFTRITPFFFPLLFAPALATLLAGTPAGIAVGIGAALLNLVFVPEADALPALAGGLVAAIAAPPLVAHVKRRTALLRAFIAGGCVQLLGVVAHFTARLAADKLSDALLRETFYAAGATVVSAGVAFAATVLLLPLLEHVFGACSNIRLNDFADLGHPLLQKLSLSAPGTYHHSVVVATLAAAAADRIGANSLLARVGSYYHDIGKLTKPNYYTENARPDEPNPHDGITPNMSAVIIAAHVKEGIGLALHYNLPPPIRDIIREHQGTTIMHWFLHKAKEDAKAKAEAGKTEPAAVDESQFRYPGPRPSTKESGIVLLADSVEAASRSLERPTPNAIENLVNNIVSGKIDDEQLDCCPLSFLDVALVKRTFTTSLTNILHARVAYPTDDKSKEAKHDADNRSAPAKPGA
ncbi:MAG: HDIG domain-containing metalloprotein [Kiritimatiellia bacterium]|jgi:putative nucleotidyltransferase with HDIG domain